MNHENKYQSMDVVAIGWMRGVLDEESNGEKRHWVMKNQRAH